METSGRGGRGRRTLEQVWGLIRCECYDCRAIRWGLARRAAGIMVVMAVVAVQAIRLH